MLALASAKTTTSPVSAKMAAPMMHWLTAKTIISGVALNSSPINSI